MNEPKPIEPGKIYEYKIDLWSTSNVFLKGHKIRVEVSSSNFPRFDRNLNTGKDAAVSAEFVKATNNVYHDAAHSSALTLSTSVARSCDRRHRRRSQRGANHTPQQQDTTQQVHHRIA